MDPPEYQEGVYNTTFCNVTQLERLLYDIKQTRINPPMRQVVEYVMKLKGMVRIMVRKSALPSVERQRNDLVAR